MPILIITRDQLLDLALKAGVGGSGDGPAPTLHMDEDAYGGRDAQERSIEDAAIVALGLRRFDPAKPEPDEGWAPTGQRDVSSALARLNQIREDHDAQATKVTEAADRMALALGCWGAVSADPRTSTLMAEEGWTIENDPTTGWTVKRRHDAYLWETDAAALAFVRQRAPEVILHQAAVNLVDAQTAVLLVFGVGSRP